MSRNVSELTDLFIWFAYGGGLLLLLYALSALMAASARRRARRLLRLSGRNLIGRRVVVVRTVAPPDVGEVVATDEGAAGQAIEVWSHHLVRAGQRARIVSLDERGYRISPLATAPGSRSPRRV